jgi:hypothetical protein
MTVFDDIAGSSFIMPWVVIKTGLKTPEGDDEVLREYLCDYPGCTNVAIRMLGLIVELRQMAMVCAEHAPEPHPKNRQDLK